MHCNGIRNRIMLSISGLVIVLAACSGNASSVSSVGSAATASSGGTVGAGSAVAEGTAGTGLGGTATTGAPATGAPITTATTAPNTTNTTTGAFGPSIPVVDPPPTASSSSSSSLVPAPVRSIPPVPSGGKDCGVTNLMSGWPTTMMPNPTSRRCIVDAAAAGQRARQTEIRASDVSSGRTTGDGYDIPAATIASWIVLGANQVQEIVDTREQPGGTVVTRACTGMTIDEHGAPAATGCSPG